MAPPPSNTFNEDNEIMSINKTALQPTFIVFIVINTKNE